MSERITRPLYPEAKIESSYGDLEKYLLRLGSKGKPSLPYYDTLASNLSSAKTDLYANWYSNIATQLPVYRNKEFGAYIHVRNNPRKLIYPSRPDIGDENIQPQFARHSAKVSPVALVHNHPLNICFSGPPGDIDCMVNGYMDHGDHIQVPVWVLATPDDNFLLLRTQETTNRSHLGLAQMAYEVQATSRDAFSEFRRFGTEIGRLLPDEEFWKLFRRAEELDLFAWRAGFSAFYHSYFVTFSLAKECKLGFYHSNKSGQYSRVTEDGLNKLVRQRYEQALSIAQKCI